MSLDRDVLDAVKDMDEHDLRRLLILTRAQLQASGAVEGDHPKVSLRPHGPYWYAYWSEDGRRRSRYVGKLLKEEAL